MITKIILIFSLILPYPALAVKITDFETLTQASSSACKKDVEYMLEKQLTPCAGYLFSPKKEYEVRLRDYQFEHLSTLSKKQSEIIDILDSRVTNLRKYNDEMSKELNRRRSNDFWRSTLYFALGVVVTGAIAANVKR